MKTTIINNPTNPVKKDAVQETINTQRAMDRKEKIREYRGESEKYQSFRRPKKDMRDLDPRRDYVTRRSPQPRRSRPYRGRSSQNASAEKSILSFGLFTVTQSVGAIVIALVIYIGSLFVGSESKVATYIDESITKDIQYEEILMSFESYKARVDKLLKFANSSDSGQ